MKENDGLLKLVSRINFPYIRFVLSMFFIILGVIFSLILPFEVRSFIDNIKDEVMMYKIILILLLIIGNTVFNVLGTYLLGLVGQNAVLQIREQLTEKVLKYPMEYFGQNRSGEVASHITNDTQKINNLVSLELGIFVSGAFLTIGSIICLFIMNFMLTFIVLLGILILLLVLFPISRAEMKLQRSIQKDVGKYNADIQQSISQIKLIKISNAEKPMIHSLKDRITALYKENVGIASLNSILDPIAMTVIFTIIFVVFIIGGALVSKGLITVGILTSFLIYVFQILNPVSNLAFTVAQIKSASGASVEINKMLDYPVEHLGSSNDNSLNHNLVSKLLLFKNVSFTYPKNDESSINNLNIKFEPNQITALVGPSGSGKSTTLGLIERFYDPTKGHIYYGNKDIKSLGLSNWRSQVSYVSQEQSILFGTIRENLTFGLTKKPTDTEIWDALSNAAAKDFVNELPDKLETNLSENGHNLSGGQIQRIMIARAFLRPAPIIIFDEATASLDSGSEQLVEKAIDKLKGNRTVIIVAHRLATVKNADDIYFIQDGMATGNGTHQELIKKHPLYRQYVQEQLL